MPVGLKERPTLKPIAGIRLGTAQAGIKYAGRGDLVVMEIATGAQVAGVFTRNRFCAAPVLVAREHLVAARARALVINAGNANAGTGEQGLRDARDTCAAVAAALGCKTEEVLPFSTGVIGECLPMERVLAGVVDCCKNLSESGWEDAARGIMTTDTVPKGVSRDFRLGGKGVRLTGIVKGAGMIRPDMATLLAFVATDAALAPEALQAALNQATAASFNRITVDGDTSTNDSCILIATGRSGVRVERPEGADFETFCRQLKEVFLELAMAVIRDAEGATKFITIDVTGGASEQDCLNVAYTVAHSPLVKTAFFASDPNWGRILAAVGRARVSAMDIVSVSLFLDDLCIVERGAPARGYSEQKGQEIMSREEITVRIDLGSGRHCARVWTSDLSHEYVRINAEYRT